MKLKFYILLSLYFIVSCSLYVDDEQPDIYFEYTDFDILELGGTYSGMEISADGQSIFLADYNNNKIVKIKSKVLIIAGSDSSGGAGIQADIKTVSALGGYAMTAITAVTAQNTKGVEKITPIPVKNIQKHEISASQVVNRKMLFSGFETQKNMFLFV